MLQFFNQKKSTRELSVSESAVTATVTTQGVTLYQCEVIAVNVRENTVTIHTGLETLTVSREAVKFNRR
jgi:hypothetical protein